MSTAVAEEGGGPGSGSGSGSGLGLGLDMGGTQTRWALWCGDGLLADGAVAGLSALQLSSDAGRTQWAQTLAGMAAAVRQASHGAGCSDVLTGVVAGVTGLSADTTPALRALLASGLAMAHSRVRLLSDIELACHAAFPAGDGIVVCAGTGAIAAVLQPHGGLERAGGRGSVIDDAGGGHWIACQALQRVWRTEDECPGAWQTSPLARHLFASIGGSDWAATRAWVYGASRGELGELALAVAAAASQDADPQALAILHEAGRELARLATALQRRLMPVQGVLPIKLAGRVFDLHPAITSALQQAVLDALPQTLSAQRIILNAHHSAARLAAGAPLP